jgi:hypothetical protein
MMNINEYRQGLMDLAGKGMEIRDVFHRVQAAVLMLRLVESKGHDAEWLKEFYDFGKAQIQKNIAEGINHFKAINESIWPSSPEYIKDSKFEEIFELMSQIGINPDNIFNMAETIRAIEKYGLTPADVIDVYEMYKIRMQNRGLRRKEKQRIKKEVKSKTLDSVMACKECGSMKLFSSPICSKSKEYKNGYREVMTCMDCLKSVWLKEGEYYGR